MTRRVNFAVQNFAERGKAVVAGFAYHKDGVYCRIVLNSLEFNGRAAVYKYYNFFEVGRSVVDKVILFLVELKGMYPLSLCRAYGI